ncbi:MAG: secondary thiamine-phosphate synthase enzyme YjbQ [Wenzhouxiangellaceae bacterium]|nr:secondary thiamine-phosphate synthase enzyme YjbQ [Wenzhouxiangellaceae bacterium]
MHRQELRIETRGRGFTEITGPVGGVVDRARIAEGMCNVFIRHTSASLTITENADPDVLVDLETVISGLVPDGDARYRHAAEGPDDMSAHIRALLTRTSIDIPVAGGRLALGTWQGLFLWEHRANAHTRRVLVSVT